MNRKITQYRNFTCALDYLEDELNKRAKEGWQLSQIVALPHWPHTEEHYVSIVMSKIVTEVVSELEHQKIICASCGEENQDVTHMVCKKCGGSWFTSKRCDIMSSQTK